MVGRCVVGFGGSLKETDALLRVQAPAGSLVTIKKGSVTKSDEGHENANDHTLCDYYFIIHQSQFDSVNAWEVEATLGKANAIVNVLIHESDEYDVVISYEYGVHWDKSSTTWLDRTGQNVYMSDPVVAVASGSGSSPFDRIYPWSEMAEFNVINNALSYQKGVDAEFSRTSYDTVVRIPKFYYKVYDPETSNVWSLSISPIAQTGYELHPAFEDKDYIYVGRYLTSSAFESKSGKTPLGNSKIADTRTNSRAKGSNWDMLNIMVWSAIQMLYVVEFADWNSQACIGLGCTGVSSYSGTGGTDAMTFHTGRSTSTNGNGSIQYRGLEDVWGVYHQQVDGINAYGKTIYICTDRSKFASGTSTNYTSANNAYSSTWNDAGYFHYIGHSSVFPWFFVPWEISANESYGSTYIPDYCYHLASNGWRPMEVCGAGLNSSSYPNRAGLFAFNINTNVDSQIADFSSRLIFMPQGV